MSSSAEQPIPVPMVDRPDPPTEQPRVPECHDGVCITCSDTAVEVTIAELLGAGLATVDTGSGHEEVSVALVPASVGDRILVHAGEAIALLDDEGSEG